MYAKTKMKRIDLQIHYFTKIILVTEKSYTHAHTEDLLTVIEKVEIAYPPIELMKNIKTIKNFV